MNETEALTQHSADVHCLRSDLILGRLAGPRRPAAPALPPWEQCSFPRLIPPTFMGDVSEKCTINQYDTQFNTPSEIKMCVLSGMCPMMPLEVTRTSRKCEEKR